MTVRSEPVKQAELQKTIERRVSRAIGEAIREEMLSPIKKTDQEFIDRLAHVALVAATHNMTLVDSAQLEQLVKEARG